MSIISVQMEVSNAQHSFVWRRDRFGVGGWYSTTYVGRVPPNCYVHIELQTALTKKAKELGLSEHYSFSKIPPKAEKPSRVSGNTAKAVAKTRSRTIRLNNDGKLVGGFNPFR